MSSKKYTILKEYEQTLMYLQDIIGSKTTNNVQLERIGKYIFGDKFIGVFSADKFPKYVRNGSMFILNTDSSSKSGSHWVSFIKTKSKDGRSHFYAYDSFNRKIDALSKYWKGRHIISANTDRDQSFKESDCGTTALSWLVMASKYNPKVIMNII